MCVCVRVKVPITIIFVLNCIPSNELLLYIKFIQEYLASTVVSNEEIPFHVNHRRAIRRLQGQYRFSTILMRLTYLPCFPIAIIQCINCNSRNNTIYLLPLILDLFSFFSGVTLPLFLSTMYSTAISHCHDAKSCEREINVNQCHAYVELHNIQFPGNSVWQLLN